MKNILFFIMNLLNFRSFTTVSLRKAVVGSPLIDYNELLRQNATKCRRIFQKIKNSVNLLHFRADGSLLYREK